MRKRRFSEARSLACWVNRRAGRRRQRVGRRQGISEQIFYRWKAEYGGLGASDAQRLKSLEDENRWLKELLAESTLGSGR